MKKLLLAASASLALAVTAAPAAAQTMNAELDFAEAAQGFDSDPLTEEEQARLPLAQELALLVLPEDAFTSTMEGMMGDPFLAIFDAAESTPRDELDYAFGFYFIEMDLTSEQAEEALTIIEPGWRARREAETEANRAMTTAFAEAMEPAMRDAMAEMYAIYFTEAQLREVIAFYATPTGQFFARQSYEMCNDPRYYARLYGNEAFMEAMTEMAGMEALGNAAPATRTFGDLTEEEQERLIVLTGQSAEDLEYALNWMSEADEAVSSASSVMNDGDALAVSTDQE